MKSWIGYGLGGGIGLMLGGIITLNFYIIIPGVILTTAFGITLYYELKWDDNKAKKIWFNGTSEQLDKIEKQMREKK